MNVELHFSQLSMTGGPRLSQQPFSEAVQLHQAENAWKPLMKRLAEGSRDRREEDPEKARTQDLCGKMRSILNKLTPEVFQLLVKQVSELNIDTEEHLRGVAAIVHEKAIAEGKFATIYAQLCHCLREVNVPSKESPGVALNFRLVLLKLCQVEFQKLGEGTLTNSVNGHRQRSIGNIRFIGELFKLEMLKVTVMHSCISKLLYNKSEEALECLCCLLSTVGQKLDTDKHLMDEHYYNVRNIIRQGRTSSRIRFLLQDVVELRKNNWFCRRGEQGPKTIRQVRRQAEMERQWERSLVQEFNSKTDNWRHGGKDLRVQEEPQPAWRRSCFLKEELPRAENVGKLAVKRLPEGGIDRREEYPEAARTQELYKNMGSVLDKLAPEIFRHVMEEVNKFTINTEERLRGIATLIFEKAISEERSAATCAKMCHCLREINAPIANKPQDSLNFRLVLLNFCRLEFKKLYDHHKMEDGQHQRSIGNMRFIGELFKLRMVKETVMHNCINKLLITQSDVALESLCCFLSIIGNILDCDEQHLMGGYVHQMEEMLHRRKVSSQVSFLLQDIVDLRKNYWFPIKAEQGYRPICQLSMEAKMENMQERIEEQQQLVPSSDCIRPGGQHLTLWQSTQLQDEGQNTAISPANNDLEPRHRVFMQSSIEQINTLDSYIQISIPRQEGTWRDHGMENELGCLSSSTLNLLPTVLLSSPFTCSLNILFDRTNWIQGSAEVFSQFNLPESLGRSSDYSKLEVLGTETDALLTLPVLPAPANPAGAMNPSSNPAPALLVRTENELERVAKPTETKRLLLCVQDTNCTLQLLIVEQKSIKSNPAGQENKVIVIHRLVKLGPLQPRQLRRLPEILHMARSSHHILDNVVKAINQLPSGRCIHMDQLFREVSMLQVHLDRTGVQKLEIIFIPEEQMEQGIISLQRQHWKSSLHEEGVGSTFVTEKEMLSLTWPTTEAHEDQSKLQRSSSARVLTAAVSSIEGKFGDNKPQYYQKKKSMKSRVGSCVKYLALLFLIFLFTCFLSLAVAIECYCD